MTKSNIVLFLDTTNNLKIESQKKSETNILNVVSDFFIRLEIPIIIGILFIL